MHAKALLRSIAILLILAAIAVWLMFGSPSETLAKVGAWVGLPGGSNVVSAQGGSISAQAREQIQALLAEKLSRTPAQQKLDSQLIYVTRMNRRQNIAGNIRTLAVAFPMDRSDVEVDITARTTERGCLAGCDVYRQHDFTGRCHSQSKPRARGSWN